MKGFILAFVLGWSCMASPMKPQHRTPPFEKLNGLSYALDLSQSVSVSSFDCIRQYGYTVVFLRCYSPAGQGEVDPAVVNNIQNADDAGLGTEVYMTPQPNSVKTGPEQFDEMYNYLTASGIKLLTVWIQVTSPINWLTSITANVNFICNIVARAQQYGLNVGIYTNYYDWSQITSGLILDDTMLWYWNVNGPGVTGESPSDFNDFYSFAGWYTPMVKQFAQVESVCDVTVNRDIYATSSLVALIRTAEFAKTKQIVVGVLGLKNTTSTSKTKIKP